MNNVFYYKPKMNREGLRKKTVVQLKEIAKKKGVSTTGKKDEIITKILSTKKMSSKGMKSKVPKKESGKIEKSKPKSKSLTQRKMEVIKTQDKNGREMYFRVTSDGKKVRVSKEVAEMAKAISTKEEFVVLDTDQETEFYDLEFPSSVENKHHVAFWEKIYKDPSFIKKVLDMYLALSKKGYTGISGGEFATWLFLHKGRVYSRSEVVSTKHNEIKINDFLAVITHLVKCYAPGFGAKLDNDQRRTIIKKMFDVGSEFLEWMEEHQIHTEDYEASSMLELDVKASEDFQKHQTLANWKKFEKAVMKKRTFVDPKDLGL